MQTYFSENFLRYSFLITCFALGFQVIEQLPHSVHRQFDSNMIQGIFQITGGNGITIFSDLQNIKENWTMTGSFKYEFLSKLKPMPSSFSPIYVRTIVGRKCTPFDKSQHSSAIKISDMWLVKRCVGGQIVHRTRVRRCDREKIKVLGFGDLWNKHKYGP